MENRNVEQKFIVCEKMESDDEVGTVVGWGSKPTIDRDKELIESSAWSLDNYRKNPVLLLCHKYDVPPVGKCLWVKASNQGLRFKAQFAKTPRGQECYELYKSGIMSAFSVGFKPRPGGFIDNPTDAKYKGVKKVFTDIELMEISCVPVPAHADALMEHVKAGKIHTKELNDELVFALEIVEKNDDGLGIEVKSTDKNTNTETKIEVTDDFIHIPAPGEEGEHKDHKIRTIALSKKEGIQGKYCIDCKSVISYVFDKKKWDKTKAAKWVADHKKDLDFEVPEDEKEPIMIKSENTIWGEDGDIEFAEPFDETKASVSPETDEKEADFMTRCMADPSMKKMSEKFRTNACKLLWKKKSEGKVAEPEIKKEPGPDAVIPNQESVEQFLARVLPENAIAIKTAEELAQVFVKASGYDDMKETVSAMEAQAGAESTGHPVVADIEKSADAEGNPSLYDLTGAVDRALNPMMNRGELETQSPTPINPINPPYRAVVDIFAVNYPSGHVVYSEYDWAARQTRYFQADYEYDLKARAALIASDPEEVLQSWIAERYMITPKEEDEIEIKSGRMISAKNRQLLSDCSSKLQAAVDAISSLIKVDEEGLEGKRENDIDEKEDFLEIEEKEPDTVELDIEALPDVKIDEAMVKDAVSSAIGKNAMKIDAKEIVKEVFAKLSGRATL